MVSIKNRGRGGGFPMRRHGRGKGAGGMSVGRGGGGGLNIFFRARNSHQAADAHRFSFFPLKLGLSPKGCLGSSKTRLPKKEFDLKFT